MVMKKKPSLGRQKIPIAKIAQKNHLQVTFSKRRSGLFKKASELSTLCGAEIAIIVFSPADKAFSFCHPDVDSIVNRYIARNPSPNTGTDQLVEAHRNANVRDLNMQLTRILDQLEAEKKHGEELSKMRKVSRAGCWWEAPVEELGLVELEQLRLAMGELKKDVTKQVNKIFVESTSNQFPLLEGNGVGHNVDDFETKPVESGFNFGYGYKGFSF